MPSFPVIDAHIHLFDRSKVGYGWMREEWPEIDHPHLMPDLDAARGAIEIEKAVFCEVRPEDGQALAEARFIDAIGEQDARLAAMTAWAPLHKGRAVEDDLRDLTGIKRVRGVRYHIPATADASFDAALLEAVAVLDRFGLHYEIGGPPRGVAYARGIAERFPEMSIVLVHMGGPDIPGGAFPTWSEEIDAISKLKNVTVKVSGTVSFAGKAWKDADVQPYLRHVIDAFGFDRCMYGSDWPASSFAHAYGDWVDLIDRTIQGASLDEQKRFYRDTARRVFRLD